MISVTRKGDCLDTHKHVHAVASTSWGPASDHRSWPIRVGTPDAEIHGPIEAFGTKVPGAMVPAWPALRRAGHRVEVNRGDRRTRRAAGKSDTIDAEVAARSVLAGQSTAPSRRPQTVPSRCPPAHRAGYGGEGAHRGDDHPEADCCARTGSAARPSKTSPASERCAGLRSIRRPRPPSTPFGRSPAGGRPCRGNRDNDRHLERPHRRSVRASGSAPTRRPRC